MSYRLRATMLAAAMLSIAGCATVLSNDGETVTVDWDQSMSSKERALKTAVESCREAGKQTAVELKDVSANPNMPAWMVKRRVTYRCE